MTETTTPPRYFMDGYYTLEQIEHLAGLSRSGLRWLRAKGRGPGGEVRVGKYVLFDRDEVHKWLDSRVRVTATGKGKANASAG